MSTSLGTISGKIRLAYDRIEAAREKLESSVDKVKERPALNTAIKVALPVIPVIGTILTSAYDSIGGGTKSEEEKAKQILEFLSKLEQGSKEQFDKIADDFKRNRQAIIDTLSENRISITDLISKTSGEILEELHSVKEDTRAIKERVLLSSPIKGDDSELVNYLNYIIVKARQDFPLLQVSAKKFEYIKNRKVVFVNSKEEWSATDDEILAQHSQYIEEEEKIIDDFLQVTSQEKMLVIGAPFGAGKSSLLKRIAIDYANKYLESRREEQYVPVLVFLKHGISNVFEQRRDSLESLLKNVIWRGGRQGKILLLLDGLDEYRQDLNYLINDLIGTKFGDYREMKIIVTTRLNAGFPDILGIREGKYLRLLPLTKEQVNLFFKNLGLDLDYDKALTLGLKEQDITKPLLALLFSEVFSEVNPHLSVIKDPKTHTSNNLSKALIYFYFIRRIFQGRIANGKEKHSVVKEKVILRKIALMKQVYKQDLTDKKLEKVQEAFGIIIDSSQIQKLFNPIIESYFFTGSEEEAIDFVHESFKEYLLAENYLEVLLKGETPSWMNAGVPSEATIDFLEGLIEILKSERESIKAIVNPDTTSMVGLLDSFEINESKEVVLRKLMENAMGNVNNENTYVFTSTLEKGPWIQEEVQFNEYANLWIYRWISLFRAYPNNIDILLARFA